jgi:hypothetical protein
MMFTIKLDGEDLVLAQDDREFVRRTVLLDRDLADAADAVTDVGQALMLALDEVVKQAWRARALDRTDGFHR